MTLFLFGEGKKGAFKQACCQGSLNVKSSRQARAPPSPEVEVTLLSLEGERLVGRLWLLDWDPSLLGGLISTYTEGVMSAVTVGMKPVWVRGPRWQHSS